MKVEILCRSIFDERSIPQINTICVSSHKLNSSVAPIMAVVLLCSIKKIHMHKRYDKEELLKVVGSTISGCSDLAIIDPAMSDQVADEVLFSILSRLNVTTMGALLMISSSKIQGVISICSLSSKLSILEILHLIAKIRLLMSTHVRPVTSWNENLQWHGYGCMWREYSKF